MSRRRPVLAALGLLLTLAGCTTTPPSSRVEDTKQMRALQARSAYERGKTLVDQRQFGVALGAFQEAVQLDPAYGDAHFHRGTALAEAGRFEEAVAAYRRAQSLPTLTVPQAAHQNLGRALFALKRYREAEASLRFALNIESQDPQMATTYVNLGLVLVAEGRTEEAKAAFRQARKLAPESSSARDADEQLKALE